MAEKGTSKKPFKETKDIEFEYFVAIDFGTHGTGLGYAIKATEEIYCEQDWSKSPDLKNKTDILLSADGKFLAFGYDALEKAKMEPDSDNESPSENNNDDENENEYDIKDEDDEDDDQNKKKPMLFESFKMALYEKSNNSNDGDIRSELKCQDGRTYSTQKVFVEALKFMKLEIFKLFKKRGIKLDIGKDTNKIQWILTVPAIWSDRAKYKMVKWAQDAGLISSEIHNHIRIVYEPDCASISCQYEKMDKNKLMHNAKKLKNKNNDNDEKQQQLMFNVGESYILIDAGGGTVDIACHKVVKEEDIDKKTHKVSSYGEYCMEEIHHPTGGPWGSDYIDLYFEELLHEIFGRDVIIKFRKNFSESFTRIKDNFRSAKCSFYNNPDSKWHSVALHSTFMSEIPDLMNRDEEFNELLSELCPRSLRGQLEMDNDSLKISSKIWREHLFDKCINPLIEHIQYLINNKIKNVKYLMLAGGLSSSSYFQDRMHKELGKESKYKLSITIPRRPILSVVSGALKLALTPNYIISRCLSYTYGIAVDRKLTGVKEYEDKLPPNYIETHKYKHQLTNRWMVRGLFSAFAKKNDAIKRNQEIPKKYNRNHKNEKKNNISIYASDLDEPFVVDGDPVATVQINFDDNDNKIPFRVDFLFGGTKIEAKCKDKYLKFGYDFQIKKEKQVKKK